MQDSKRKYLERYAVRGAYLDVEDDSSDADIFIIIPSYDEPELLRALSSIKACNPIHTSYHIIVVFNDGENDSVELKARNRNYLNETRQWILDNEMNSLVFLIEAFDLPARKAGVGLARKIGLDEAVRVSKDSQVLLVCLDADCYVSDNYLQSLEIFHNDRKEQLGCSIYYEHPVDESSPGDHEGIIQYELFLRYFVQAQRWAGLPYSFQTVGSAMAARVKPYIEKGGMNVRKAGEDFYFIHKIIEHGPFEELNSCTVYPSTRPSFRVPFGTGKAIIDWNEKGVTRSYSFSLFKEVKQWLGGMEKMYEGKFWEPKGEVLLRFLSENNFESRLIEIRNKSKSFETFNKHFFSWFNAFRLMKFARFHREVTGYSGSIIQDAKDLVKLWNIGVPVDEGQYQEEGSTGATSSGGDTNLAWMLLKIFREIDKKGQETF